MYKYETHLHTFPVSRCSKSSVRESLEYYKELGYSMNAIVGKSGCEASFEEYLHGQDGIKVIVDVVANHLANETGNDLSPKIP